MLSAAYDAIIVGLGAMGSAAAYHLARRGKRVLGLEKFWPAHDRGSSHGESRIIRQSYFESPAYVPLLLRAYELWHELEGQTGRELLRQTGGLMIGAPESEVVRGSARSARTWNLPHRLLDTRDLRREFPQFHVIDEIALYEDAAGALFPEDCILAHQGRAVALGATLRFGSSMTAWRATSDGVEVEADGEVYTAASLVVTAGAWAGRMLADLGLPLSPERNVLYWFDPGAESQAFLPGRFPLFIWELPGRSIYGLPNLRGSGVKTGFHHSDIAADPDHLDRVVTPSEVDAIRARMRQSIPALDSNPVRTAVCIYTNTPDEHFAIGLHPSYPQISIAAGFSGHGFKFSSSVGEVLAGLAIDRTTTFSLEPFALDRFSPMG